MKRIWDSEKNCLMAIDGEYEFELKTCFNLIEDWKKRFFRKNSKEPVEIKLRCFYAPPEQDFWKYYIEISRKGNLDQTRICKEAYEYLKGEKPSYDLRGQVEFVTLEKFEPCTSHKQQP